MLGPILLLAAAVTDARKTEFPSWSRTTLKWQGDEVSESPRGIVS
jgi:hypothetical protein